MHEFERNFMNTFFYACEESIENMKIEHLISNFNSKNLIFITHTNEGKNVHDMDIIELKEAIRLVEEELSTKLDKTLLKLLDIRLEELIKEEKAVKSRIRKNLIERYKKETLKWMDRPEYMIIQTIPTGLLKRNLESLKEEGLWDKYCDGFIDPWVEIVEMELKVREQETQMKEQMWPSSEGPIHVSSMNRSHINNCINRLKRDNKSFSKKWLRIFYTELARREEEERLLEEGRQILIAYKSNDLSYAYKDEDGNSIVAFVHEMPLSHLRAGLLYTSEGGYNAQWPEIFKMEIGKREEEIRQIIKSISYASAYGTTGTLLSEYCVCILNLSLLGNFNRI